MSHPTYMVKPPSARLKVDLDKTDVSVTGFYFCLGCQRITELEDIEGLGCQGCAHCRSLRVEWRGAIPNPKSQNPNSKENFERLKAEERVAEMGARTLNLERRTLNFEQAEDKHPRLAPDKRDLRVLFKTGYYFCFGCRQVTEVRSGPSRTGQECGVRNGNGNGNGEHRTSNIEHRTLNGKISAKLAGVKSECLLCGAVEAQWQDGHDF